MNKTYNPQVIHMKQFLIYIYVLSEVTATKKKILDTEYELKTVIWHCNLSTSMQRTNNAKGNNHIQR